MDKLRLIDILNKIGESQKLVIYGTDGPGEICTERWIMMNTLPSRILESEVVCIGISNYYEDAIVLILNEPLVKRSSDIL